MGLFGRLKRHTKGNFEENKDYEWTNSKEEKMRLNLLQHLTGEKEEKARLNLLQHFTGENFHRTHDLRFVCYDFADKD